MKQLSRFLKKKKILSLVTTGLAGAFCCSISFADTPQPTPTPDDGAVVAAINALGNKVEALALASIKTINNTAYQFDQGLLNSIQYDNTQNMVSTAIINHANRKTEKNITDTLEQFPDNALTYTVNTPDVQATSLRIQNRNNLNDDLTINTPASDTLYTDVLNVDGSSYFTGGYSLSKPTILNDDYFNFGTMVDPQAYTSDQEKAVHRYVDYLTQDYQSLTDGIDFTTLVNTLNSNKSQPDQLAQLLHNFMNSSAYKNYQLSVRSMMASRTVSLTNFNRIITERTPLETTSPNDNLATVSLALGVKPQTLTEQDPQNAGHTITKYMYASPMQIESYLANHRLNDPQWAQNITSASPATLQRETVVLLAEIESQMYQHHLDEENILATLSVMQMQSSQTSQLLLKTQISQLNQEIKTLAGTNAPATSTQSNQSQANQYQNSSGSNSDAQQAEQAAQQAAQQQQNQSNNGNNGNSND